MISTRGRKRILKDSLIFQLIFILLMQISVDNFCSRLQILAFPVILAIHLICYFSNNHHDFNIFVKGSLSYSLTLAILFSRFEGNFWIRIAIITSFLIFALHIARIYSYSEIESFVEIVRQYQELSRQLTVASEQISTIYIPDWIAARKNTVHKLKNMRKKLDEVHYQSTKGQFKGAVANIAGSILNTTGIILAKMRLAFARNLINMGSNLRTSGRLYLHEAPAASIKYFSSIYIEELDAILAEDRKYSQPILEFLEHTKPGLNMQMERVFGVNLPLDIFTKVVSIFMRILLSAESGSTNFGNERRRWREIFLENLHDNRGHWENVSETVDRFIASAETFCKNGCRINAFLPKITTSFTSLKSINQVQSFNDIFGDMDISSLRQIALYKRFSHHDPSNVYMVGYCGIEAVYALVNSLRIHKDANKMQINETSPAEIKKLITKLDKQLTNVLKRYKTLNWGHGSEKFT